ncbi:hypothetical protein [Streptomyces sp. NPDC020607]|uniref:hypothetical protein n=1 Tax=Streptomyces sp. NPDC020607 TaxID=3365082 RepID=UPI0037877055
MDTPLLTNRTTGAVLGYDVILDRDEGMTVDTFESTVTLNGGTGTSLLTAARPEPSFVLVPGPNPLAFRAAEDIPLGPGAAVLRWRSAYWLGQPGKRWPVLRAINQEYARP